MVLYFAVQQIRNETVGKVPFEVRLDAGSFYWGDHLRNPIVHKVRWEEQQTTDVQEHAEALHGAELVILLVVRHEAGWTHRDTMQCPSTVVLWWLTVPRRGSCTLRTFEMTTAFCLHF